MAQSAPQSITLEQLSDLRDKSERLSSDLASRLRTHLDTLYPLLAPRRILGKYLGAREPVPRAEEAYAQLADRYREVCGSPFELRSDLDEQALASMEHGIEVSPWEYTHELGGKAITVTSPVRWVVTYRSDYTLPQVRSLLAGKGERKAVPLRSFVVNALAIQIVLARTPGLTQLLSDLRYELKTDIGPGLGKLPLMTVGLPIRSFRPADELILAATRFSGVPAFIELVDMESARSLSNPLQAKVDAVLMGQ